MFKQLSASFMSSANIAGYDLLYSWFHGGCMATAGDVYSSRAHIHTWLFPIVCVVLSVTFIPGFENISEGIDILKTAKNFSNYSRQIWFGWKTISEHEMNVLAEDLDDEKRIIRAENSASRKVKSTIRDLRTKWWRHSNRTHPNLEAGSSYRSYSNAPMNTNRSS